MTMRVSAMQLAQAQPSPAADNLPRRLASRVSDEPNDSLCALVAEGSDRLPWPGSGHTQARFRALATVAAHDLSLVKLFEGHTDALAILHELGVPPPPTGSTLGMWAAEAKGARVQLSAQGGAARLFGRKAWCSGAAALSHALLTVWGDAPRPSLALVDLRGPGVRVTDEGFLAVGMAATRSVDVIFEGAPATVVGLPGAYLSRPGFWQGAVGIAACWYGGALGLANALLERARRGDDPIVQAHLGAVEVALASARALLRGAADEIDAAPQADVQRLALATRCGVEAAVTQVIERVGRGVGAAPFCRDEAFARRAADLPVFLRQSHAEHDLAALGARVSGGASWAL